MAAAPVAAEVIVIDEDLNGTTPGYLLRRGSGESSRAAGLGAMIVDLQSRLDDWVVERSTLAPVHAGVVTWHERAVLLPGRTRSGKTTLVTELVKRGATYFSDELALLDRSGLVHPYPRSLCVRVPRSATDERIAVSASSRASGTLEMPMLTSPFPLGASRALVINWKRVVLPLEGKPMRAARSMNRSA